MLDRRDIKGTVVELQGVSRRRARARPHLYGVLDERRRQEDKTVGRVDVVLENRVVEDGDAHKLDADPEAGDHPRGPKGRQGLLGVGVEAQRHDVTEAHAECAGRVGGHHHLVWVTRDRPPALHNSRAVLNEETTVRAR